MKELDQRFEIVSKKQLIKDVYEMEFNGNASNIKYPGQFINISIPGKYLRRPMSICDYTDTSIKIIFRVVGEGTELLAKMEVGDSVDILVGLGNGFTEIDYKEVVVIGGGLGVPPMYATVKNLLAHGVKVSAILGFNSSNDAFYVDEFKALCPTFVATMDGSLGTKGTVIDAINENDLSFDAYYTCGPVPMLEALAKTYPDNGYLSYEARMGCGFGACMGCSMLVKGGYKRICKEGPILLSSEVIING